MRPIRTSLTTLPMIFKSRDPKHASSRGRACFLGSRASTRTAFIKARVSEKCLIICPTSQMWWAPAGNQVLHITFVNEKAEPALTLAMGLTRTSLSCKVQEVFQPMLIIIRDFPPVDKASREVASTQLPTTCKRGTSTVAWAGPALGLGPAALETPTTYRTIKTVKASREVLGRRGAREMMSNYQP